MTQLLTKALAICALAVSSAQAFQPIPQPPTELTKENLEEISDSIGSAKMRVLVGNEPVSWPITQTELAVFMGKLKHLPKAAHPHDTLFAQLPEQDASYKGLEISLTLRDGERLAPLHIFEGNIIAGEHHFGRDAGRALEYWLFGTAKIIKQQILAVQVLPVFTFEQCQMLGNVVVETHPRQCLLADNNLIFDVPEKPTLEGLKVKTFDECLEHGAALIHTFPRRCMVKGGRVFTEPPRLLENPRSFSLMKPVGKPASAVSETADDGVEF